MEANFTLEDNFEISETDLESQQQIKNLEMLELARSETIEFILCANPNDADFEDLPEHTKRCLGFAKITPSKIEQGFTSCQRCGRIIELFDKEIKKTIP